MNMKLLLSAILSVAAWSLSSMAAADWNTGPCPGGGNAPCIETMVSGNTYHFNGTGDDAGEWHGLPTTGEDFAFSGAMTWGCNGLNLDCTLVWRGRIKKCQDTNGDWRIGLQVNSTESSGAFLCGTIVYGGFPWYANDPAITTHCPFEDTCDSFVPYDSTASSMVFQLGSIDMNVLGISRLEDAHLHAVTFTPGVGASFDLNSEYYDCDEAEMGCQIDAYLSVTNATSIDIK